MPDIFDQVAGQQPQTGGDIFDQVVAQSAAPQIPGMEKLGGTLPPMPAAQPPQPGSGPRYSALVGPPAGAARFQLGRLGALAPDSFMSQQPDKVAGNSPAPQPLPVTFTGAPSLSGVRLPSAQEASAIADENTAQMMRAVAGVNNAGQMPPAPPMGTVSTPSEDVARVGRVFSKGAGNAVDFIHGATQQAIASFTGDKAGYEQGAAQVRSAKDKPIVALGELQPGTGVVEGGERGIWEGISQLSSPENLALVAGTGGAGKVAQAAASPYIRAGWQALNTALSGYFALKAGEGADKNVISAADKFLNHDYEGMAHDLTGGSFSALIGAIAGKHAAGNVQDIGSQVKAGVEEGQAKQAAQADLNAQERSRRTADAQAAKDAEQAARPKLAGNIPADNTAAGTATEPASVENVKNGQTSKPGEALRPQQNGKPATAPAAASATPASEPVPAATESAKADAAGTVPAAAAPKEGDTRDIGHGPEQLARVPLKSIVTPPPPDWRPQGNILYPERVAEYVSGQRKTDPVELRPYEEGTWQIHEGNHRVDAARQRAESHILAWIPAASSSSSSVGSGGLQQQAAQPAVSPPAPPLPSTAGSSPGEPVKSPEPVKTAPAEPVPAIASNKETAAPQIARTGEAQPAATALKSADTSAAPKENPEGDQATVKTARGTMLDTRYAVVPASTLITSHDTALNENPQYPAELQPRDRTRAASEAQISDIAGKLDPRELGSSYQASTGAPIVGSDHVVESGNGRTIALQRLYQSKHPNGQNYRQWLTSEAPKLGVKGDLSKIPDPVLVRMRNPVKGEDRPQLAREMNQNPVLAMSESEQGRADANHLDPKLMALFAPSEEGDLAHAGNRHFVRGFMDRVGAPADLQTSDGQLSQAGVRRVRNAIFAKAYGAGGALERMAESPDNEIRNVTNGMVQAAGHVASLESAIAEGKAHDLSIAPEATAAAEKMAALRGQGQTVQDYIDQVPMFGGDLSPDARTALWLFDRYKRSPKKIGAVLREYGRIVQSLGDPRQQTLTGTEVPGPKPNKNEILRSAAQRVEEQYGTGTGTGAGTAAAAVERPLEPEKSPAHGRAPDEPRQAPGGAGSVAQPAARAAARPAPAETPAEKAQPAKLNALQRRRESQRGSISEKPVPDASSIRIPANLSPREGLMARAATKRVQRSPQHFVHEYRERFGNEFNADNAAELLPEYNRTPEQRTLYHDAVHNVSAWIRDEAFRQALREEPAESPVIFTAGGTGAGKSSAAASLNETGALVYDTTLSNYEGSVATIDEALASGRRVRVLYVHRDPGEAFRGVLARAAAEGQGRTVPVAAHVRTHQQAAETVQRLADHYAGDPRVRFRFQESRPEGFREGTIDLARNADYTGVDEQLHAILDEEQRSGRVSEALAQRTRGAVSGRRSGLPAEAGHPLGQPLRGETGSAAEGTSEPGLRPPAQTEAQEAAGVEPTSPEKKPNLLRDTSGGVGLDFATLGARHFVNQDILPAAKNAATAMVETKNDILKALAPAALGPTAKSQALIIRPHAAELARKTDQANAALEKAQGYFDRTGPEHNFEFMDRIENNRPQPSIPEQSMAGVMTTLLNGRRDEVRALGEGALDRYYVNYFPHIFEDTERKREVYADQGKKPLEGSKAFLQHRVIRTIKEARELGLEPISSNPVDLVLAKLREMDKFIVAHKIRGEMGAAGLLAFSTSKSVGPEGYTRVDDPLFTVRDFDGGVSGYYYAPDPAARVLNNYLSPGLQGHAWYRAIRGAGNMLNQAQLGMSGYHAAFTTFEAATSRLAAGLYAGAKGQLLRGATLAASSPAAPFLSMARGDKMLKEWYAPGTQGEQLGQLVDAVIQGGGRAQMDRFYQTKVTRSMMQAFRSGNVLGGILRAPFAGVEQASRPIMEWMVPRLKLGAFSDLAGVEIERLGENASTEAKRAALGRAWDSIDNRFGQLVYDNLFWHKAAKDMAMISVRSVGWNVGDIRELAGGAADSARFALGKSDITPRATYIPAMAIMAGLAGALLYYLWNGKAPEHLKDYYFPRDSRGRRWNLPSYVKDVHNWGTEPLKTARNKVHPLLSLAWEMLSNEDYFGDEIRNPDHPLVKQAMEAAKHVGEAFEPISARQMLSKKHTTTEERVLPFFGLTRAPKSLDQKPVHHRRHHRPAA